MRNLPVFLILSSLLFNLTIRQTTDDLVFPAAYVAWVGWQKPDDLRVMIKTDKVKLLDVRDLHHFPPP
jgi:hypothetical protein